MDGLQVLKGADPGTTCFRDGSRGHTVLILSGEHRVCVARTR